MALIQDLVPVPSSTVGWLSLLLCLVSAPSISQSPLIDKAARLFLLYFNSDTLDSEKMMINDVQKYAGGYFAYILISGIYTVFFHPLSKYPGPWLWAMSIIPYEAHLFHGDLPYATCKLHEKYGPVIRILPNELSYIKEDAWNDIYGKLPGKPQLIKNTPSLPGPPKKLRGLFNTTSDVDHARMRRNFSYAFSDKALREQEPIMKPYFDLLIQRLHENCAAPVDIVMWYNSTTFDIVGDLLFGESYDCLETSKLHMWVSFIFDHIKAMRILGLMKRLKPLDTILLQLLPAKVTESGKQFRQFHLTRIDQRLEKNTPRLDFMSHVQKSYNTPEGMHIDEIRQTCGVFVVAGSETTATLLSGVTYFLLQNPSAYQKLAKEIRESFKNEEEINITNVSSLKYLLAVLEEALRCFPPVAGSQTRLVPPEGRMIAGAFVPGKTLVGVNQWSAYRSTLNFKDPYDFVPERWLGDPKYKDDKRKVLQPFSVGPRNCIGQNLAHAEMRVVLARILWNFDIALCEESQGWIDKLEIFTLWKKQPLMVKLTPVSRTPRT